MQRYNIGKSSSRRGAAFGGFMLALVSLVAFLPNTHAQQAADSPELELGVLITARAEDAAAILKQIESLGYVVKMFKVNDTVEFHAVAWRWS